MNTEPMNLAEGEQELPREEISQEQPEQTLPEEPEKNVFGSGTDPRRQAQKDQAEAARREEKARKEAERLEHKIAMDHQREERRLAYEEECQRRQEEKARQRTVRRVGTMTMGLALIAIGGAILWYMIDPSFNVKVVAWLAPIILIGLGTEILFRYFFSKDHGYKYDFASGVICFFLVIGSLCVSALPQLMYYAGPQRSQTERQARQELESKVYAALQGDANVDAVDVSVYVDPIFDASMGPGKEYQIVYRSLSIRYLTPYQTAEAFAAESRSVLDRLTAAGITADHIRFYSGDDEEAEASMNLNVNNPLQWAMDTAHLAQRVQVQTREVEPEGHDRQIQEIYQGIKEQFGETQAANYLEILSSQGEQAAETYRAGLENPAPQVESSQPVESAPDAVPAASSAAA